MKLLNKILVIGNLGNAPEMRFTNSGKPVTSFSVATNRKYTTTDGEKKEDVEWFNVVTWGKLAESCNQYLEKGSKVYVEGRQQTQRWEGKEDGVKHEKKELHARQVIFLSGTKATGKTPDEIEPEDIPF